MLRTLTSGLTRAALVLVLCASAACGAGLRVNNPRARVAPTPAVSRIEPHRASRAGGAVPALTYVVKRGDTLYSIAKRYNMEVHALARANAIRRPADLRVGARLALATSRPPVPRPSAAPLGKVDVAPHRGSGHADPLHWPLAGVITSRYGMRAGRPHDGIDIGAPPGAPVRAAADGEVVFADRHGGYGNVVIIKHPNGLMTVYAHHEANLVHRGQHIREGQTIARVGSTGNATGPHLHFEVRRGSRPDNPMHYLPALHGS